MTGAELYERMEGCWKQVTGDALDPFLELTETEQLCWEKLTAELRPTQELKETK